jgi:hypothetical protein
MDTITVRFLHPRASTAFPAALLPDVTGQEALQNLQSSATGPFLEPAPAGNPYTLVLTRTKTSIPAHMSMAEVGVHDGDEVQIGQDGQGA